MALQIMVEFVSTWVKKWSFSPHLIDWNKQSQLFPTCKSYLTLEKMKHHHTWQFESLVLLWFNDRVDLDFFITKDVLVDLFLLCGCVIKFQHCSKRNLHQYQPPSTLLFIKIFALHLVSTYHKASDFLHQNGALSQSHLLHLPLPYHDLLSKHCNKSKPLLEDCL